MPIIKVFLAELCNNSGMTSVEKSETRESLARWFGEICQRTQYTSQVIWVNNAPALNPTDLLCYFLPNNLNSLLTMAGASLNLRESHGKTWVAASGTLSEVYVGQCRQSRHSHWIPQLAFHELMHNKLGLNDSQLHAKDGLAKAGFTASVPSRGNISDMRNALGVSRPQWIGGWGVNCTNFSDAVAGIDLTRLGT